MYFTVEIKKLDRINIVCKYILFMFICLLICGCKNYKVTIFNINFDGIIEDNNSEEKQYAFNAVNNLMKFNLLPEGFDTLIVIEDQNDPLMLGCIDYAVYGHFETKYYRLCRDRNKLIADTLYSFYSYKNELLNSVKSGNLRALEQQLNKSLEFCIPDDSYLTTYRFCKTNNDINVDIINIMNRDYFRISNQQ